MGMLDAKKVQELVIQNARSQSINLMNDPLLGLENHFESINSSSIGRVRTHLKKDYPLFVIAVARDYKSDKQIENDLEELKAFLLEYGLGFIPLLGTYKYEDGTIGHELSCFVPYYSGFTGYEETDEDFALRYADFTQFGKVLGEMYDQESVLMKGITVKGTFEVRLHYMDGNVSTLIAKNPTLDFEDVAEMSSQLMKGTKKVRKTKWNIVEEKVNVASGMSMRAIMSSYGMQHSGTQWEHIPNFYTDDDFNTWLDVICSKL